MRAAVRLTVGYMDAGLAVEVAEVSLFLARSKLKRAARYIITHDDPEGERSI